MLDVLELTGSWARHAKHSVTNFVSHRFFNEEAERVKKIEELIGSSNRMIACYKAQNIAVRNHDILHRLKDIDCPVLVMSGGQDPLGGPILTGWMLDRFPNVKHIEFKQSSHFFLMEEHNLFMQHMNDWFIQHTPK
jgi:3-oxoadipate enol-lactonase